MSPSPRPPTRRPYTDDEMKQFFGHGHRHTDEREGDGMQPTWIHRPGVIREVIGNDGLTDTERQAMADEYRAKVMRPLNSQEKADIEAHLEARRTKPPETSEEIRAHLAAKRDADLTDYPGEVLDSPTARALVEGLARAHESEPAAAERIRNSLIDLADEKARSEGWDKGRIAGRADGLHEAIKVPNGYRDQLSKEPYSDDTVAILDDIREDLVKAVSS